MENQDLFHNNSEDTGLNENKGSQQIICLGKIFNSEEERRDYFRNQLQHKPPELKKLEGFPIGEDEDIINLSDPPYYTACPNPWLNDFIAEWELEKKSEIICDFKVKEPYANDISVGKNNPIYNAHGYHTKVPHPAIMRYILHYTQPGDIVLDGFAGTGMTGVAGLLCENPDSETKFIIETEWREMFNSSPRWGLRHTILEDLSPIASFIGYNYNTPVNLIEFDNYVKRVIAEVEKEYGWIYETNYGNNLKAKINYTIWSDVFACPQCGNEIVYWETVVDKTNGLVREDFKCNSCKKNLSRSLLEKKWVTKYDKSLKAAVQQIKTVPVLINYIVGSKRYDKIPDAADLELIEKIESLDSKDWYPTYELFSGDKMGDPFSKNIHYIHQFWTARNLKIISSFWAKSNERPTLRWIISSVLQRATKQHQIAISRIGGEKAGAGGKTAGHRRGTLYIPSLQAEFSVFELIRERLKIVLKSLSLINKRNSLISTNSATKSTLPNNSVDYIFIDPPFGANIMYSELNYIWESWLKVRTNNKEEAIENKTQKKKTLDYQVLITRCFEEYYRILKPGKWLTVEFSNTSAAVWTGIQTAIQRAGFIIANVTALHKKQETHSARTTSTAVKQDLVISCYKISNEFESNFNRNQDEMAVWEFVSEHLSRLSVHVKSGNKTTAIIERSPKILFDRLIKFYLMRNISVPIDAQAFQVGLREKYVERDGMFFTFDKAAEYDEKKGQSPQFVQLSLIVNNESDAIEWLKGRLRIRSQKYQDITNDWMVAIQAIKKEEILPELKEILKESFIQETDGSWRTPDPNEAKDREALRTKVLLKEFNGYVAAICQPKAKKLKEVRVEALRSGFKNCWEQKDFKTIVTLGDMIPQKILLEDEQLLMYYDIAKDRV